MKLIVGIGNPGEEYDGTRHNIGFEVLDVIAKESEAKFAYEKKFDSEIAKGRFADKPVILVKPFTYVNKSGEVVRKLKLFYKLKPEDIIVIQDDLDIEFGEFKVSFEKDSGGHRGVQSIIDNLKSKKFWRLRIGTANRKLSAARRQPNLKAKKESVGSFVLSRFTPSEKTELKKIIKKALERLSEIK
jgi:PTH1 family peptidyl-tRNA hydrolase